LCDARACIGAHGSAAANAESDADSRWRSRVDLELPTHCCIARAESPRVEPRAAGGRSIQEANSLVESTRSLGFAFGLLALWALQAGSRWRFGVLAVLAIITLLPSLYLLATSFTQLNLTRPETLWDFSQPFESYHQLWADTRFHNSIWVQIKLSFWTVLLQLLIGLGLALLLNMRTRLLEALRTVFLIPMVLPPIVVAIIWKVIYTPDISPMHGIFRAISWNVPALITDPNWALTAIIIAEAPSDMACEAAVLMRRRSADFIRARRPSEAFNQRPDRCLHLPSFVSQLDRPLTPAAGPYMSQVFI
jgi:hypothetical protein